MCADFQSWVAARQSDFEEVLGELLPRAEISPQRLHEAMRYAVLDGGKRVRPLLAFAAGELAGATANRLNIAATAVELIHAYSLVHDDMPCMDNDVLRRGKPTCHVQYGEATALLVGDSLQTLAFQLLAEHRLNDDAQRQLEMIKLLAMATGSRGMAGGQAIDLASVGKSLTLPELEFMHIHKTGALIRAAILLGAYCGTVSSAQLDKLDRFGKLILRRWEKRRARMRITPSRLTSACSAYMTRETWRNGCTGKRWRHWPVSAIPHSACANLPTSSC